MAVRFIIIVFTSLFTAYYSDKDYTVGHKNEPFLFFMITLVIVDHFYNNYFTLAYSSCAKSVAALPCVV